MTRKTVESSVQQVQSHEDHWLAQWVCSLSVIIFLIAFGLSGQVLPRFVANQCTSEQGMCTPGECTCPFPLMKRDMVTQDAQACSQCVEEFCPAVTQGDSACSTSACECEDASWPRIDVGSPEKPCWQCVHPHKDMTLRGEDGDCLDLGQKPGTNRTCTIFRYTGAVMLDKSSGSSSCLTWSSDSWQIMPCQGSPDSSGKFTQRNSPDEDIFCTSRGKQCLHVKEYMCTADPSQCSTGVCRCEDPTHVRKEMQTVNGSACYLCSAPVRECPLFPEQCSSEPCECKPGFFKARPKSDEACFSCQPGVAPSAAGFTSLLGFLSAGATFLLCVALGVVVGCAIRRFIVGDPAPNARRRRRGSQPRSWSENCALYLEDAIQVVYERVGCWKPLKRVSWAVRKVVSLLDACDAALDPVYGVLEAGLDKLQHSLGVGVQKAKTLMGQADTGNKIVKTKKARDAREKDSRPGHGAPKEPLFGAAVSGAEKDMHTQESLSWDPINVNVNNQEWMNCVVPSLSAQRQSARYAKNDTLPPTSAVQRLRQRREAKAQAAEKATPPATVAEAEVDESWIDLMEQKEAKEKEAKEKAAAQRRERKHAAKARRAKVAAGFSPEADNEDVEDSVVHPAKKEKDSKAQGTSSQEADRLFSEAIHGMFLLATSDARREEEVDPEKPEDDEEDSDGVQKADSMDSQILPDKENFSPVPDKLANEDEDTPEVEDGWTKSCSSRSRVKRRGDAPERTFSGPSESGQMPSEQEPAAEPDPQQVSDDLRENAVAAAPDDLHETGPILSKRQKQRLRQRQDRPKVAKPKEEKPEAAVVPSKRLPFKEEQQQDVPDTSLAPEAAVEEVKPEAKAEAAEADAEDSSAEEENADVKPEEPKLVRSFADLVAGRPARPVEEEAESAFVSFKADAPEFVPMSMTTPFQAVLASGYAMAMASEPVPTKKSRRGRRGRKEAEDSQALPLTTVVIAEIANLDAQSLRLQLDACGFAYNFFYMPPERQEEYGNCAVVNFVDPSFVIMCQQFFEQSGEGNVSFFPIQGLDNNVAYWTSFGVAEDMINGPLVFPSAVAQWSEDPNMLNSKFSPQIKEQFHKTKLCVFNKKQKCSMGSNCPFAHSEEELQKAPDLTKTKLCYNFFRRKCNDSNCKFAHGYGELRATDTVFKTELCRWWANGSCKAGSSCRYAHGIEELRSNPNFTGMFGADFDLSEESMDFGFGFYPYLLEEQLASMAAEDGSADAGADADADAQMERSGSDGEVSEALTSEVPGQSKIQRQQTAPPAVAFSKDDDNIILRIKGTFMEAVRIDEEMPLSASMRRSWSDGDLAQLCEAIESDSD